MTHIYKTQMMSHTNGREDNQDRADFMVGTSGHGDTGPNTSVLYVADGVSNANGTRAAQIIERDARKPMAKILINTYDLAKMTLEDRRMEATRQLKEAILELDSSMRPINTCMSTFSLALVMGSFVYTANLGDSPILLVRLDEDNVPCSLKEVYTCHNRAGVAVAAGKMTKEEALTSDWKDELSVDVLGMRPDRSAISTAVAGLGQNNLLLMGSDGALSVIPEEAMMKIIADHIDDGLGAVNQALFRAVKAAGGDDNYTLLIQWIQCS